MFLKALQNRNRAFLEAAVTLHQTGQVPAGAYLLDLDTMTENARLMSAEAGAARPRRAGDDQADRPQPAGARCAQGRRHRPLRCGRHGLRPADPRQRPRARPHRPPRPDPTPRGGGGRGHARRLLDRLQRGEGGRGRAGRRGAGPRTGTDRAHSGAGRYLLFRPRRGLRRGCAVEAVADALDRTPGGRFAGLTTFPALLFDEGFGRGAAHAQSRDPERGRVTARQAGPARHRHQRAGHHVGPGDDGARGRRRDPGGAGPRAHRHDTAPRPHRPAGAPGDALPDGSLPLPPGPRLLLRRRPLHRPGVRAIPAQGAGGAGTRRWR